MRQLGAILADLKFWRIFWRIWSLVRRIFGFFIWQVCLQVVLATESLLIHVLQVGELGDHFLPIFASDCYENNAF